jgi:tetratricopeptide (TPR) repeat protein
MMDAERRRTWSDVRAPCRGRFFVRRLALASLVLTVAGVGSAIADDTAACHDRAIPPDDAIAACDRLLGGAKGDLPGPLVGRGHAFLAKRDYDRAISDFDQAMSRNPRLPGAYGGRAKARYAKGDFEGAIADYDQALRINPKAAMLYLDRGNVWRRKGDIDRAIADFSEAIRVDPAFAGALISRGLALEAKGERALARADYEAVVALPPKGENGKRIQDTARARLANLGLVERGQPVHAPQDARPAATPAPRATPVAAPATVPAIVPLQNPAKPAAPAAAAQPQPTVTAAVPSTAPAAGAHPKAAADSGYRLALVIGNGAYVNATALPNPTNDARAVAKLLKDMGFEVIEGTDLDRTAMERNIREFLRKAPSARVTMLFYAGHGMQVDGKNFLVPVDAKLTAPSDLGFETIELDKILAGLDDEARANIVILDACRDNPLARSFASRLGATRSSAVPSGLAGYPAVGTGTLIAFATAPGQTALDGRDANSPFTSALIKYMRTPGLEVNQMLTRVRVEVAANTANKQIPWANSSLLGDVYLAGGKP